MTQALRSNLELVHACDRYILQTFLRYALATDSPRFPYDDPFRGHQGVVSSYYVLLLPGDNRPHGLLLPSVVSSMPWTSDFEIDHSNRTVKIKPESRGKDIGDSCALALSGLVTRAIDEGTFAMLHGQHSELYPIVGASYPIAIERFARSLFGIIARGAHLTVFTRTRAGMRIWVPRRSAHLFTYPNCLDTTVAGGVTAGEGPFECIVREGAEEASLPERLVQDAAHSCGVLSYISMRDYSGDGENGLVSPDLIYIYDLEVTQDVILKPGDDDVSDFYLWDVDEVKRGLARGEFKTNSAVVMIDFLMRHGVITPDNERDYAEISARIHRRLPFPTSPK